MPELRKDYILDRWVIIATERAKRPSDFQHVVVQNKQETACAFCPGNQEKAHDDIFRTPETGSWNIRVIHNKYPAVRMQGDPAIKTHNEFYTFADAYGSHEVVIETPDHAKQLWDLTVDSIVSLLDVFQQRITALLRVKGINYVQVFKNHDIAAGTSIAHSHSQIIGYNIIPKTIRDKQLAIASHPGCAYCSVIEREKDSYRRCFENTTMIAFTPYASRFPFEIFILPKKHITTFAALESMRDLASILKQTLDKLHALNAPYNLVFFYAPDNTNIHFHIEVLPRLTTWAGFEYSGTIINPMPPEEAARYYRGELS